ncbi:unnamed protein product [Chrysoparadoxa australica]
MRDLLITISATMPCKLLLAEGEDPGTSMDDTSGGPQATSAKPGLSARKLSHHQIRHSIGAAGAASTDLPPLTDNTELLDALLLIQPSTIRPNKAFSNVSMSSCGTMPDQHDEHDAERESAATAKGRKRSQSPGSPQYGLTIDTSGEPAYLSSLKYGGWPLYAHLSNAMDLLTLRALHMQLCNLIGDLTELTAHGAPAPLIIRNCGTIPFLFRSTGNDKATSSQVLSDLVAPSDASNPFYSSLVHPLYIWAQVINRQLYAQVTKPLLGSGPSTEGINLKMASRHGSPTNFSKHSPLRKQLGRLRRKLRKSKGPRMKRTNSKESMPSSSSTGTNGSSFNLLHLDNGRGLGSPFSEEGGDGRGGHDVFEEEACALNMLQPGSGLDLHSVKYSQTGTSHPGTVRCFFWSEAVTWLHKKGPEASKEAAYARLKVFEQLRIIKMVRRSGRNDALYMFVDSWEVEPLIDGGQGGGVMRGGPIGRSSYVPMQHSKDGLFSTLAKAIGHENASNMWESLGGEAWIKTFIAKVELPCARSHKQAHVGNFKLEEAASGGLSPLSDSRRGNSPNGGDSAARACHQRQGMEIDTQQNDPLTSAVYEHICRNALFRLLKLPHRFLGMVHCDLLEVKNLSPHFHPSTMEVFALVRLKRPSSSHANASASAHQSLKHHHMGCCVTPVARVRATGDASQRQLWGAKATFRFALPEEAIPVVLKHGISVYSSLLKQHAGRGPAKVLQIALFKKQFLGDAWLGDVEVPLNCLNDETHLNEWVPLKGCGKSDAWFVNIRVTVRFVGMTLGAMTESSSNAPQLNYDLQDFIGGDYFF